ncbi:MAG: Crp/Fnr family transcriptional regulator [Rhodomicrobium sp.]|nr:Crp/Fnr family transcriptional regulator [Rhodomicrobium sp.]
MPKDPVSIFRRFEILSDLADGVLEDLAKRCTWHSVPSGKQIILSNEESRDVYLIATGKVRILLYSATQGRQVLFTIIGPYQIFGEISAIDGLPRSATVEAEGHCRFAILTQDQFKHMMHGHPAFCCAIMRQLTGHIRRLSERVFEFSTLDVPSRVHSELLRYAAPLADENGQALIPHALPRSDFAARISTSREQVSRVITGLEDDGIARREGSGIRILDVERLRKLVAKAKGE